MFLVYFLTEWLPIFVIYLTHLHAFIGLRKREEEKRQTIIERNNQSDGNNQILPLNASEYTKRDEFQMLIANVSKSPGKSYDF